MKSTTITWGEKKASTQILYLVTSIIVFFIFVYLYNYHLDSLTKQLSFSLMLMISAFAAVISGIQLVKNTKGKSVLGIDEKQIVITNESTFLKKNYTLQLSEIKNISIYKKTKRLDFNKKNKDKDFYLVIVQKDGVEINVFPYAKIGLEDLKAIVEWMNKQIKMKKIS
ncbi:hypothetical protein MY04_1487 [Flammeovirga sp. MY04]|uniref:hypothetical protein n=1 Tax=Flammeovirga sp. MY04 TaxID=1191459 RepID=UPI0008062440|nr:hypothetical protein [Flammeovirga sp. MY04]ANQ48863.1 hypothetical protein MY04_1487 [Flammeovirga sp. MY04]